MDSDENKRGRVRKKSAKVREMEEFEEEERKSNKKPAPATPPTPIRKGSNKPNAPVVTPSSTQNAEATVVSPPTVGKTVTTPPPKTPPTPDSDPQGKGSVIKLLLSSPVQPSTPASGKQGKKGGGDVAKNPVAVESGSKKASKSKKRTDGEHDGKKKLTALSVDTTVHSETIGEEGSLKMKFILSPKDKTLDSNSSKKGASVEKTSNQGLINMLKSDSTPAPVEGKKGRRSKSTEEEKSGENLVKSPVEKKKKSMSNWIKQIGVKRKVDDPPPASATVTQTEEEAKKPKPEEAPKIKEEVESPPPKKSKPEKIVIKQERLDEGEEGQAEETVIVSKKGKSKEIAYVAEIVKAEPESDLENAEDTPPVKKKEIVSPSGKRKLEHPSGNKKKLEKALGLSRKMEQTVVIKTNPSSSIEYQLPADQSIEDMDLSSFDFDEAGDLVIAEENKTKKLKKSAPKSPKKIKTSAIKTEKDEHSMDVSTMGSGDVAVLAKRVKTAAERKMRKRLKKVKVVQPEKPKLKKKRAPTAYMLWCNTQRQKVVTENPGADFVTISRRLGELWQCLTDKEKLSWKNKAKKSAGKGSTLISTGKSGGSRTGPPPQVTAQSTHNAPASAPTVIKVPTHAVKQRPPPEDPLSPIKGFGTEPVDVAAHLKLVGESLCIIGVRLQEHRGLIAVQGSLSVLLDSMLCACGPLMCLTQKLPEMDGCNSEVHARTLDNVAYIMPGL